MIATLLFISQALKSGKSPAEAWFCHQAKSLNLLVPPIELTSVQQALSTHLPQQVERVLPWLINPEDASEWLNLILKANFLIRLRQHQSTPVMIAINVSGINVSPSRQLALIQSPQFTAARQDLGIAKHWCLNIPDLLSAPSRDELLDELYDQLEITDECALLYARYSSPKS